MERVIRQAHRLQRACSDPAAEWGELSLALTELADAVELLGSDERVKAETVREYLTPLAPALIKLLKSIRSKLVADTCEQLRRVVRVTRRAFQPLANLLLEALAHTAKGSSVAIREPGFRLFSAVSEHARYDLQALHRIYKSSSQERVRVLILEQIQILLASWGKDEVEPFYGDVVAIFHLGMRDPSSQVRAACRQSFCSFSSIWPERIEELVDIPTPPARDLLLREKPHAEITKALKAKYYDESSRDTRVDSGRLIRQRRAEYRKQTSSLAENGQDPIFIEVTESPMKSPPPPPSHDLRPRRAAFRPTRGARSPAGVTKHTLETPNGRLAPPTSPTVPVQRNLTPLFNDENVPALANGNKENDHATNLKGALLGASEMPTASAFEDEKTMDRALPTPAFSKDRQLPTFTYKPTIQTTTAPREQPDAFLDRPIPSSQALPTPRLVSNITLRERRSPRVLEAPVAESLVPSNTEVSSNHQIDKAGASPSEQEKPVAPVQRAHMMEPTEEGSSDEFDETMLVPRDAAASKPDALKNLEDVRNRIRELRELTAGAPINGNTDLVHSSKQHTQVPEATIDNIRPLKVVDEVLPEKRSHPVKSRDATRALPVAANDAFFEPQLQPKARDREVRAPAQQTTEAMPSPGHESTRTGSAPGTQTHREHTYLPAANGFARRRGQPMRINRDKSVPRSPMDPPSHDEPTSSTDYQTPVQTAENTSSRPPISGLTESDESEHVPVPTKTPEPPRTRVRTGMLPPATLRPQAAGFISGWGRSLLPFVIVLGVIFGLSGLIQAASKVRDAYEYHQALLVRINQFESSIIESYESVRKMDEKYSLWSEYVRELADQDESNAIQQLESIQQEVSKWQEQMKSDLLEFKRSLSGDMIDAALAPLRQLNATTEAHAEPSAE